MVLAETSRVLGHVVDPDRADMETMNGMKPVRVWTAFRSELLQKKKPLRPAAIYMDYKSRCQFACECMRSMHASRYEQCIELELLLLEDGLE